LRSIIQNLKKEQTNFDAQEALMDAVISEKKDLRKMSPLKKTPKISFPPYENKKKHLRNLHLKETTLMLYVNQQIANTF